MPVSPSGRRARTSPSVPASVRKTSSVVARGTLPIRCTSPRAWLAAIHCGSYQRNPDDRLRGASSLWGSQDAGLFEDAIGPEAERLWNRQALLLRSLQVQDELELGR